MHITGKHCKTLIFGKDEAPTAFPLKHTTTKRTNLRTPSQVMGGERKKESKKERKKGKKERKKKILFQNIFCNPFKCFPPIPVKYRLCCGKKTNVNFLPASFLTKKAKTIQKCQRRSCTCTIRILLYILYDCVLRQ